jgi:hypothetical protein
MKHQPFLLLILALLPYLTDAQNVVKEGKCGDTLEGEFKDGKETQDIEIFMNAGDMFEVMVVPINDDLKIRAEVFDADNQAVATEEPTDLMFKDETVRSITLNAGALKSSGTYRIRLFNYDVDADKTGVYNTYIKCIKSNGDIINPK